MQCRRNGEALESWMEADTRYVNVHCLHSSEHAHITKNNVFTVTVVSLMPPGIPKLPRWTNNRKQLGIYYQQIIRVTNINLHPTLIPVLCNPRPVNLTNNKKSISTGLKQMKLKIKRFHPSNPRFYNDKSNYSHYPQ